MRINRLKKLLYEHRYICLVLLIAFVSVTIYCINKNTYNNDESLSYALSNFDQGWVSFPYNGVLTRYQMDGYRATNNLFNYEMVWHWQALDEHPPFYYALLHTVCSLTPGLLSKWSGLSINIFFYLASILLMYVCMNEIHTNKKISSLICLLYAINPVVLQYTMVIRMYVMLTFTFLLFAYGSIKVIKTGNYKFLPIILLATIIGGLTNYFFYVFLVVYCLTLLLYFLLLKLNFKLLLGAIATVVVGVLINLAIFPWVLDLFFQSNNSALTAFDSLERNIISFGRILIYLAQSPYGKLGMIAFIGFIAVILCVDLFKNKLNKTNTLVTCIFITFLLYFALISTMAFDFSYRFISPIDPLFYISLSYCVARLITVINKKAVSYGVMCLLVVLSLYFSGLPSLRIQEYKPLDFAMEHKGDNLIVASLPGTSDWAISRIFMERDYYGFVYNTDLSNEAYAIVDDLYWMDSAVVYANQNFDTQHILNWLTAKTKFTNLEDTGLVSHEYKIYIAN